MRDRSEEKYQALFHYMDEAFAVVEVLKDGAGEWADFRFLDANPAFMKHTSMPYPVGKTATELLGNPNPRWTALYGRVIDTGEPIRVEESEPTLARTFDLNIFALDRERNQVAVLFTDITERKAMEHALRESEARLRIATEAAELGVWEWDAVTDTASWENDRPYEIFGRDKPPLSVATFLDEVVHPDDAELFRTAIDAALKSGQFRFTGRFHRSDGTQRWLESFGKVEFAPDGTPLRMSGVSADVTERMLTEQALRESEAKFRTLFESIDQGLAVVEMIYDEHGGIVDMIFRQVNGAYERQSGVSDVVGRSVHAVVPDLEESWIERLTRVATTGEPERVVDYNSHVNRWFEAYFARVDEEGRFVAFVFTNVSERKAAEQELREREERQAFLLKLSDALRATPGEEIVARAAEMLAEELQLDLCYVVTVAGEEDRADVIHQLRRRSDMPELPATIRLSAFPKALATWQERTLVSDNLAADPDMEETDRRNVAALHFGGLIAAPVRHGPGTPIWSIVAVMAGPRHWTASEVALVEETAERSWAAVERSRAERALRNSEEQFRRSVLDAPIPVIMHAEDGEVLQISRSWTELTGYTIEDSHVIQDWLTRAYGFGGEGVRGAMEAAFAPGGSDRPMRGVPFEIVTREGERRSWSFSASSPGRLSDGRRFVIGMAEDITERTRAEQALAESETLFRTMAEVIEDVFYVTDLDAGRLIYLSSTYDNVWGRPAAELMGDLSRFIETIHPDDRAEVERSQALQASGGAVHSEYRIVRPDGEIRWILDRCFPIPDGGRRLSAGVASDITDRREAEERVRAGEERLRLLVESVRDYAIFTTDRDGIITSWPAGATAVFGWSEAEMLGRSVDATFTPEDSTAGEPRREREIAARDGLAPNVRWHLHKGGSLIFIEGSTQPLVSADGEIREFIKIGQDVTEARRVQQALAESEQRMRTLTEGIPQLVWRSADQGQWTWSSPQWQRCTGQSLEESLGLGWLETLHPDDRARAMQAWDKAVETGGIDVEYRVYRAADGAYLWHHTRSVPVRDEGGRIIEWLGTTTDVQQLKGYQERQEVMVAELQHRTRNLISVVRSIAQQTMAQTGPTEAFRDEFNHRLEALARVQGLLSRSDEEPITIEALIRMELDALGAKVEPGRIDLTGPSVRIRHSVVQTLALALHELATNARKYGALSNDKGHLDVGWRTYCDDRGERLALDWAEVGGEAPKGEGNSRRGYGRELIEQALPYSLDARTSFEHDAAGLRCTIDMPLSRNRKRRKSA